MSDIAQGFRNADGVMQGELAHCLDYLNSLAFFRDYKEASWEALRIGEGARILDVACGTGFDVIEMARRHPRSQIVGVDRSQSFLDIARAKAAALPNVAFAREEADRLGFEDDSFDGVRIDRSLQHIASPQAVIDEMIRVTRPGGRIVACEPDWGTFFVYNGDLETGETLAGFWRRSFVNPYVGRQLAALIGSRGVTDLACRVHALALTRLDEADVVFDLARLCRNCVAAGALPETQARGWWTDCEAASKAGTFLACLNIIQYGGSIAAKRS